MVFCVQTFKGRSIKEVLQIRCPTVQLSAQRQLAECSMIDLEVWRSLAKSILAMEFFAATSEVKLCKIHPGIDQKLVLSSFSVLTGIFFILII